MTEASLRLLRHTASCRDHEANVKIYLLTASPATDCQCSRRSLRVWCEDEKTKAVGSTLFEQTMSSRR